MHLQQTKAASRSTGGPQYYFHAVPAHVKEFLRKRGACPVVLQTPYGIAASAFMAVGKDHKLLRGSPVPGNVGHDRIQQATGEQSIGEAIRHWYGLREGDFETIDVEVNIHEDGHFILVPTAVQLRGSRRKRPLEKIANPLSFHHDYHSKLWRSQIAATRRNRSSDVDWATDQIKRVVDCHRAPQAKSISEADLLRTSGALSLFGLELSAYLLEGYDCNESTVEFSGFPKYICPVEVKNRSSGFSYQMTNYPNLPRAVILCMVHNFVNPPEHIDIIELPALANYLESA